MTTTSVWKSGFVFESQFKNNHLLTDDITASGKDDSGFSPKALLLSGLAGCTGIDIVAILDKMKAPYEGIRIEVSAEQTDTVPKVFKEIFIRFVVKIDSAYQDKVQRAVDLSLEKYCGVAAMLRKHCLIHSTVIIEP